MEEVEQLLVFTLDERRYALPLNTVERVVRIPAITPLPKAPDIVPGVVNIGGRVIAVVDIRKRFHLPERETDLGDQLIIARTAARPVAIVVDSATGVIEQLKQKIVLSEEVVPGMEYIKGILKCEGGLVFIHDLDGFLFLEEEKALEKAIKRVKRGD